MVFSVEETEYRMLITWEMEEFDRSRKLFHSRARTHGRRWRSQRPAAGATVRVALPELGPRQVGSWPRQWLLWCHWEQGKMGGNTPASPVPCPPASHLYLSLDKEPCCNRSQSSGEMSVHDTEQRKSKELLWDQTGRWLAWMGIGQLGPKAFFVCLKKLGRINQVLSF